MLLLLLLPNQLNQEELKIHFGVDEHYINASTLSQSLINITDLIRTIDLVINPGYEIEILVEGTGPGSFRIDIRKGLNNLRHNIFNADNFKNFAIGIFTTMVWEMANPEKPIVVINNDKEYILQRGDERIVLPKNAEQYYDSIKRNDSINNALSKTFETIKQDKRIHYMEFSPTNNIDNASVYVERERFDNFILTENNDDLKEEIITTKLTIIRAVLEKGNRKWQFLWNGIKISAPIKDESFYSDFAAHNITIAPGDNLEVSLKIIKIKDADSQLYFNKDYEVAKVIRHNSNNSSQTELGF